MPFRVIDTYPIRLETSVGVVTSELWSNRLLGVGLDSPAGEAVADADGVVGDASDVRKLLAQVGVPSHEPSAVAARCWAEEIAPTLAKWDERSDGAQPPADDEKREGGAATRRRSRTYVAERR